jgi:hypothetical protein
MSTISRTIASSGIPMLENMRLEVYSQTTHTN